MKREYLNGITWETIVKLVIEFNYFVVRTGQFYAEEDQRYIEGFKARAEAERFAIIKQKASHKIYYNEFITLAVENEKHNSKIQKRPLRSKKELKESLLDTYSKTDIFSKYTVISKQEFLKFYKDIYSKDAIFSK